MKRSGSLRRSTPLRSAPSKQMKRGRIKPKKRDPQETLRIYGPPERRAFVSLLPCVLRAFGGCSRGLSHNAHVGKNRGMSKKGPYTEIAPLCARHHRAVDERRHPFDHPAIRERLLVMAAETERAWLAHLAASGGPA